MYSYLALLSEVTAFAVLLLSILGASKLSFAQNQGLRCLVEAYPGVLSPQTNLESNRLLWRDGTSMPYDDAQTPRSFEKLLDEANLKDQMKRFLKSFTEAAVRKQLVRVYWSPAENYVMFSQNAGAATALATVGK